MMGLDEGWVCGDDLDLSRTGALKMLGNGVVPAQAALALTLLDPLNHSQEAR
jgi:DNA (cytosine-5)-methyltransferase 1